MIKSRITFKQLEAFAFVVDTGTFRAAATALGTTQPNISSRITALEAALDVTLLYRDAGSVRLTDKGAALLRRSREVLWAGEALIEEAGRRDLIEERLRLGVTELVACTWLQDFLRRLKAQYPQIRVELEVDLSNRISERLQEDQLDLSIQNGPFKTDMTGTLELGQEAYVWIACPDLAKGLEHAAGVEAFFNYPVLTHAKHTSAAEALHAHAKSQGIDTSKIVHSSALSACVPMACEGLGVALLPQALVRDEIKAGKLILLESDWAPAPLTFFARFKAERMPRFVAQSARLAGQAMAAFRIE